MCQTTWRRGSDAVSLILMSRCANLPVYITGRIFRPAAAVRTDLSYPDPIDAILLDPTFLFGAKPMDGGSLLFDLPPQDRHSRKARRKTPVAASRPQPIRDAILGMLTEPRTVKQIAEHINRRTCIATGHLRAMQAKGLAVRLSWGVWVRPDRCSNAPDPSSIKRNYPAQDLVLAHLKEPQSFTDLLEKTGQSRSTLQHSLQKLQERDVIKALDDSRFVIGLS